jgi:hypothetical protein
MENSAPLLGIYDPLRHDSHVIALFDNEANAGLARDALRQAGVPGDLVAIMADGAALHGGLRHPVQDLFVPEDDYHDYHHAIGRGHALLIVSPASVEARDAAVAVLEGFAPLDLEQHGRRWRGTPAPSGRMEINHANVSRADMRGRAVGGRDEVILDMTGQKMTVRMMSEADMAEAPFAPISMERPAPLAPPPPTRDVPVHGTSYTYGVPLDVVQRMSPQEQVMAQPHTVEVTGDKTTRGTFLRVVDGQTRVGWRDPHPAAVRVRSYVTERPTASTS